MKTDLLRVNRLEKIADSWTLTNGKTGLWVGLTATGVGQPTLGKYAVPIFTESNRDGSAGFTGDVSVTKGVTVLLGKFEGVTDQFAGTPAVGDKLFVTAAGVLANATGASMDAAAQAAGSYVAICTKASTSVEWFGNNIDVIEFVTV